VTDASQTEGSYCYRHPDRQSFVLCQRCGRTICGECQTPAAVGFHCPECMKEARASMPRVKPRVVTAFSRSSNAPVVTYSIIALCVLVWVAQLLSGGVVTQALLYFPPWTATEPWRLITSAFVHSATSPFHILFNMWALWLFGSMLERMLGRWRFLALYLLSALGGSVAVLWLSPLTPVVGASGAVFGLFGAFFMIQRRLGGNSIQLIIVIGLNLAIGFIVPGISWQGHVGGLLVGVAVAWVFVLTRSPRKRNAQLLGLGAILAVLVALTVLGDITLISRVLG
jgi:membrane associated rhomboid family serine protease